MAAQENGLEQQLEFGKDVFINPSYSTFFANRLSDGLEEHGGKVSIGGITITNLRSADDIGALAGEEQELALLESLDKPAQDIKWI